MTIQHIRIKCQGKRIVRNHNAPKKVARVCGFEATTLCPKCDTPLCNSCYQRRRHICKDE